MIKENYEEYIVEFSVAIVDPLYRELLRDPKAPEYNDITRELTDKVRDKYEPSTVYGHTVNFKMPLGCQLHFSVSIPLKHLL